MNLHSLTFQSRTITNRAKFIKINFSTLILLSYLAAISIGTVLLLMPSSTVTGNISFIDALFTATSAVCVTGLVVVDTGTFFSFMGQIIIMILIQLGGLGIMSFSVVFFLSIGRRISYKHRKIMQAAFAHTPREDIYKIVRAIFIFTAIAEIAGGLSLFLFWLQEYPVPRALYLAVFHSVSAFCNAGFSLFSSSFMHYSASPLLNITICSLIILGGIGFPAVYELHERFRVRATRPPKLSVHTKSVLITSLLLIIGGMLFFAWGEYDSILGASTAERIWIIFFQSVTARTAGFNTVDMSSLNYATLTLMMYLMFWGASPGSCGGGVKTTTFAVLGAFTWSRLLRRSRVNMFKKSIPGETISRSISLIVLSISIIFIVFFLLLLTQADPLGSQSPRGEFVEYLFETISAFSTVGLSMGATAKLNTFGKLLIIFLMLVGRVGVLTFAYIIAGTEARGGIQYAEQNLMIG